MDNCFTRLRVTVNDPAFVKEQALKALPCSGVVQSGCDVQIVYGIRAPEVRQAVERRLNQGGLLTFGGRATIIGKKRLPVQSERIFCVPPIYSRCATAISRQQQHAVSRYDFSREKVTPKRPQSFRSYKFKNNISADIAKANASAILKSSGG